MRTDEEIIADLRERIGAALGLGELGTSDVVGTRPHAWRRVFRFHIAIKRVITFEHLAALSKALVTSEITIVPAKPCAMLSDDTWDEGRPAYLVAEAIVLDASAP